MSKFIGVDTAGRPLYSKERYAPEFNSVDVAKVATALLSNSWQYNDDYMYYSCKYCNGKSFSYGHNITHELECPVLIAKDLLTGLEDLCGDYDDKDWYYCY